MYGSRPSTVTLRAMMPYLVFYKILGLIPIYLNSNAVSLSDTVCRLRERLWWKLGWTRLYSAVILLLVTGFLYINLSLKSILSQNNDVAGTLESVSRFSIFLNVFGTVVISLCYLSTRLCYLVNKMVRCEQQLITQNYHLKGQLAIQCWTILAIGVTAAILNELTANFWMSNAPIARQINSTIQSTDESTLLGFFRLTMAPFAAGIWPFVDFSVIQLSLIFSCYQRRLRQEIDRWSSLSLREKECLRLAYWNVQALIKEADELFSPVILIASLSCVAHLGLEINLLIGTRTDHKFPQVVESEKRNALIGTGISVLYLTARFVAASHFCEKIHQEKVKSLRSLCQQPGEEFWSYDLGLLITKRFVHQLTLPLGFTGCGFFKLGKSYLIAMCGTILTYEIVLMDMAKTKQPAIYNAGINDSL